jgi:hypothetical protein
MFSSVLQTYATSSHGLVWTSLRHLENTNLFYVSPMKRFLSRTSCRLLKDPAIRVHMTSSYLLRHGLRKYALLVVYECFPCSPKTAIRGHHVCIRASKTPKEKAEHNCVRASLHHIENRKWPICRVFEKTRRSVSCRLLKRIGRGIYCVFLFSKNFRYLLLMGARCTKYINFVTSIFSTTLITHFLSLFQNLSRADVWRLLCFSKIKTRLQPLHVRRCLGAHPEPARS